MKILTVKNALKVAVILPFLSGTATFAVSLSDPNVVGTITKDNPSHDTELLQDLLDITVAGTTTISDPFNGGNKHITFATDNPAYSGTVGADTTTTVGGNSQPVTTDAGYDFIVAKYGNSAIVFYAGGNAIQLPGTLQGIFPDDPDNNGKGDNGGGLSGFVEFSGTVDLVVPPEGTPTPDGGATMLLLGGGVTALAYLRRKLS